MGLLKLIGGIAKKARDFFQSIVDMIKDEEDEESKEAPIPKKRVASKKSNKKAKKTQVKKPSRKVKSTRSAPRDPNAPKKPLPAFLMFSNYKRSQMKKEGLSKFEM